MRHISPAPAFCSSPPRPQPYSWFLRSWGPVATTEPGSVPHACCSSEGSLLQLRRQPGAPCCCLECFPERQQHQECAKPLGCCKSLFPLSCWVCKCRTVLSPIRTETIQSLSSWLRLVSGVLEVLSLIPGYRMFRCPKQYLGRSGRFT